METVFDYLVMALAKDYLKHPSKYHNYGFLSGLYVAKRIYRNTGFYDLNDVEEMSDEELLEEALVFLEKGEME